MEFDPNIIVSYDSIETNITFSFANVYYGRCVSIKQFFSLVCYILNTNEIPGELLRENIISSHMKITHYLHM